MFQTAERSGPSTIDRSYRPGTGDGDNGAAAAASNSALTFTSVKVNQYSISHAGASIAGLANAPAAE